jgi:hypothetical protein
LVIVATFIEKGFYSQGEAYFWKELAEGILSNDTFYYFQSADVEKIEIKKLGSLILHTYKAGLRQHSAFTLMRQRMQLMFPSVTRNLIRVGNSITKLVSII